MEIVKKYYKAIIGVIVILFCFLPFSSFGDTGFSLFSGRAIDVSAILLILLGALSLIFATLVKEIELTPKYNLTFFAKWAIIVGLLLAAIGVILTFLGAGFWLILILALALIFESQIVDVVKNIIKNQEDEKNTKQKMDDNKQ